MKKYKHLSLEEREKLYAGIKMGLALREIGKELKRHHATLSRELHRNAPYFQEYIPCRAHAKAIRRAKRQRRKAPLKEPLIFLYVREKLREGWSPETIAGRLPIDHPGYGINNETIYRYIYKRENRCYKLWEHLLLARKKRMKKEGRKPRRQGKIPDAVSIDQRPVEVAKRQTIGHWETDNMEGKREDKEVVSVTTERLARLTLLSKLSNRTADAKTKALIEKLELFPEEVKGSMTADNGSENSYHQKITNTLNMPVFFCHAYHAWEKGTVENTIGRIRRYVPKGESLDNLTNQQIATLEEKLNQTPRKCLNYLTPYEKMEKLLSSSKF